jgi:hypothetical protein
MTFDERVWISIREARDKYGYNPTGFINMISELGVLDSAKRLINSTKVSDGYTRLWELGRLDLSVEAIILEDPWKDLFTDREKSRAKKRLAQFGFGG